MQISTVELSRLCLKPDDMTSEMRLSSLENGFLFKNDFMDGRWCKVRKVRRMRKDFVAAGPSFCLGNIRVMNWCIILQDSNPFVQHAMPLRFDGVSQFLQE